MAETRFDPGAFVQLKGGGRRMVVNHRTSAGLECVWETVDDLRRATIHIEALQPYDPREDTQRPSESSLKEDIN